MNLVNGMVAVNGGKVIEFNNGEVEILNKQISGHPEYMVVSYAKEGMQKVTLVYNGRNFVAYRFRTINDLQHHWSRKMNMEQAVSSKKYSKMALYTINAYNVLRASYGC